MKPARPRSRRSARAAAPHVATGERDEAGLVVRQRAQLVVAGRGLDARKNGAHLRCRERGVALERAGDRDRGAHAQRHRLVRDSRGQQAVERGNGPRQRLARLRCIPLREQQHVPVGDRQALRFVAADLQAAPEEVVGVRETPGGGFEYRAQRQGHRAGSWPLGVARVECIEHVEGAGDGLGRVGLDQREAVLLERRLAARRAPRPGRARPAPRLVGRRASCRRAPSSSNRAQAVALPLRSRRRSRKSRSSGWKRKMPGASDCTSGTRARR